MGSGVDPSCVTVVLIIKELETADTPAAVHPTRRIVIIQRSDGCFCYAHQYYYVSRYDGEVISEGWCTLPSDGVYADAETAEVEGRREFAARYEIRY